LPRLCGGNPPERVVLHVGGLLYASEKAVVERKLGARTGVLAVDANPVPQTATVVFDAERTSRARALGTGRAQPGRAGGGARALLLRLALG
jgi:copper chaperone CopZ